MNYKNLFIRQSYFDNFETYDNSLKKDGSAVIIWDYIILTASNEDQAESYNQQINHRIMQGSLPKGTHYAVIPDFEGKRVGSGGATLSAMRYIYEREGGFDGLKIMVIHSGGDSKRVPQYSACGKLFSPVPCELPDGNGSTIFDNFIVSMSGVPARIGSGMLVVSGDVLLLFNPLQIEFFGTGAAALSIKENVNTGKNHGVFLRDTDGFVGKFLHKQPVEELNNCGAADKAGKVNIDTGAVILGSDVLKDLYSLVGTEEKFREFVNDRVRLSFYADFVYPMAKQSTLREFYEEKPEGDFSDELYKARAKLWDILHKYSVRLICLSPASFLHFGTSAEILKLLNDKIADYSFLDWKSVINCNISPEKYAVYNGYIASSAVVGAGAYIENSIIGGNTIIGKGSIVSGVTLENVTVPEGVILHGLRLKNGKFVVRMLGVTDNPKENFRMGQALEQPLWDTPLFGEYGTMTEAVSATLSGVAGRHSLRSSFEEADVTQILPWIDKLKDKIETDRFIDGIKAKKPVSEIAGKEPAPRVKKRLIEIAEQSDFSLKIRIFYYLSRCCGDESLLKKCFETIRKEILDETLPEPEFIDKLKIAKDEVAVSLPVRVNWGGGWTDTPPYCMENGGMVLNAAAVLDGNLPVTVTVKRLNENKIVFSSTDSGSYKEFYNIEELKNCSDPNDPFALHKAALFACGVIPYKRNIASEEVFSKIGGGIFLDTAVTGVPKGSGLGTSSILAAACVKALFDFFGIQCTDEQMSNHVLCMEQIMSTGGGWQDQVGGLIPGIKMISSKAGKRQKIICEPLMISDSVLQELNNRFCLIYTGQRRLARNLLREVVGKYIGAEPEALEVLYDIQRLAVLMKFELERGNIDGFCKMLNEHWEKSKLLDSGCTNTCIDQIFNSIDDLIDGKMICGAGGGGFLQVILKKGITEARLRERLAEVFEDSGVEVFNCNFYMGI